MKLDLPNKYQLSLKPPRSYQVFLNGTKRKGFHAPDTKVCPKLYVVLSGRDIHYVGITNRPMSARINYGLKARGKSGYHGYHWKNLKGGLNILVWAFPQNEERNLCEG
ncbi:MAG: hypothetical protein OEV07_04620 [Gammaproteobacteria bacterium]|nr:hypothetical protein [Gammaproteobacteria bacterium]